MPMNLEADPKEDQLRDLLARYDDTAGHHLLWVKRTGEVEITLLPHGQPVPSFEKAHPEMQMRWEPFLAGNEYVGPEAAADAEWVTDLFDRLQQEWRQAKGKPGVLQARRL
jgi:hypothetical protein